MAFFDKIGTKITNAGQGVAAQTKTLAEIAKINLAISNNEKVINELYNSIGKLVYEQCKDKTDGIGGEFIAQINQIVEENINYKNTLNNLKGIIPCPNCGQEVSSSNNNCNFCGAVLPKPVAAVNTNVCKKCNAPIEAGTKFCFNCGEPVVVEEAPAPVAATVTCSNCSEELPAGTKFCNKCGTKLA